MELLSFHPAMDNFSQEAFAAFSAVNSCATPDFRAVPSGSKPPNRLPVPSYMP